MRSLDAARRVDERVSEGADIDTLVQGLEQLNEAIIFLQDKRTMAVAGPALKHAVGVRARLLKICEVGSGRGGGGY